MQPIYKKAEISMELRKILTTFEEKPVVASTWLSVASKNTHVRKRAIPEKAIILLHEDATNLQSCYKKI